jgi:glycyl-tRNA synthetase
LTKNENFELKFNEILTRRFIYNPSFNIHESYAGFYDYGPVGCAIQTNLVNEWRKFFVFKEHGELLKCLVLFIMNLNNLSTRD